MHITTYVLVSLILLALFVLAGLVVTNSLLVGVWLGILIWAMLYSVLAIISWWNHTSSRLKAKTWLRK